MTRKAFVMQLNPGALEEYRARHNPIWDDLETVLKAHGVHNYSIYHLPVTNQLFAYVEVESEALWTAIANTDSCRRWWTHMAGLMAANSDDSPTSIDLVEVFHLD